MRNLMDGKERYLGVCARCGREGLKRNMTTLNVKINRAGSFKKLCHLFMHCKCGEDFRCKTNITRPTISHTCIVCKAPVDMEINKKNTAYVTIR